MYRCNPWFTTFISQPTQFIMVFLLFQFNMVIYFAVTRTQANQGLIVLTVLLYILITIINLVIPFIDPGILPKILFEFDDAETEHIPFDMPYFRKIFSSERTV